MLPTRAFLVQSCSRYIRPNQNNWIIILFIWNSDFSNGGFIDNNEIPNEWTEYLTLLIGYANLPNIADVPKC